MAARDVRYERWWLAAALAAGAFLLFWGLGGSGLWEPWEMDRADVARTLVEKPVVALAVEAELAPTAREAAETSGVALRVFTPQPGARGVAAGPKSIRDALDHARDQVVAGVLLDQELMGPVQAAGKKTPQLLRQMAERVDEGRRAVGSGYIVIMGPKDPAQNASSFARDLAQGRARAAWTKLRTTWGLGTMALPDVDAAAWATLTEGATLSPQTIWVARGDSAGLTAALTTTEAGFGAVARFKREGTTYTAPPLESWLRALSYKVLGQTETATRLPGALIGFLTLLLIMMLARTLWGTRVAALAVIALATTPLFFAQARSAAGEPSAMLGLTLIVGGMLLQGRGVSIARVARWLLPGLLILLLGKGLFGLLMAAGIIGGVTAVAAPRRLQAWIPAIGSLVLLGLLSAWVLNAPVDGFAGQFRFTQKLFADGPAAYDRNFDLIIRQIGFGTLPWAPLTLIALGVFGLSALERKESDGMVLLVGFAVPTLAVMGFLKAQNQFIWPAAPIGALAAAVALERILKRGYASRLAALVVLLTAMVLTRELGKNPEPLAAFLAYDLPFTKDGGLRFPEAVLLSGGAFALLASVMMATHMARVVSYITHLANFFARPMPGAIGLAAAIMLLPLSWLIRVLSSYSLGMRLESAAALSDTQRHFLPNFLLSTDPMILLGGFGIVLAVLMMVTRIVALPTWHRWLAFLSPFGPALIFPPVVGRGVRRALEFITRPLKALPWARAVQVGGGAFFIAGVIALFSVIAPEGYWAETFVHPAMLVVFAFAIIAMVLVRRAGGSRIEMVITVLGIVGLFVATRLSRDADHRPIAMTLFIIVGGIAWARALIPRCWNSAFWTTLGGGALISGALFAVALPLLDRWDQMVPLLYPDSAENLTRYLMTGSRVTALLAILAIGFAANIWLRRGVEIALNIARPLQSRTAAVVGFIVFATVFSASAVTGFYPELAYHVSQKHILDTYRDAEGLSSQDYGDRLFRHGNFARVGRRDVNFYTGAIPEIRDQKAALAVLLGAEDQVVSLDTADGTEARLVPGWDPANDADKDGARDTVAIAGIATETGAGFLVDANAQWAPNALVGQALTDATGARFTVAGNDATRLTFKESSTPTCLASGGRLCRYTVESAPAANANASAMADQRNYLLLPAGSFSSLNHAFRKQSDGAHIPVIDSRSYRVLLAASELREGETQENRYARHTLTREQFDALGPEVHRAWANFDNKIRVLGYKMEEEVVSRGKKFRLTTYFETLAPVRTSHKIFLHVDRTGTSNRIHGDHWPLDLQIPGSDGKTCTGCYRTDHWMAGDIIMDVFEKEIPIGTPSGPQDIWMGLYTPGSDKRLPVQNWDTEHVRHDGQNRVRIGAFQVR